jgi:hypothetical protein
MTEPSSAATGIERIDAVGNSCNLFNEPFMSAEGWVFGRAFDMHAHESGGSAPIIGRRIRPIRWIVRRLLWLAEMIVGRSTPGATTTRARAVLNRSRLRRRS